MIWSWSAAAWIVSSLAAAVNPGTLLISVEARDAYLERWEGAMAAVRFTPPSEEDSDPDFRPWHEVGGTVVDLGGVATVIAPSLALRGVGRVEVRFRDGRSSPASVEQPVGDRDATPMVRLTLADPTALKKRPVLTWAGRDEVVPGAVGWMIEPANFRPPDGSEPPHVLVDTGVGAAVEWPLDRLNYVSVERADGRPVLDADGRVLCIVYRQVPGVERSSLCVSGQDALIAVLPREGEPEPPKAARPAPAADLP
jgi:hypothetical protein